MPRTNCRRSSPRWPATSVRDFRALLTDQLAREHGLNADVVLDYELSFYDTQPAAVVGLHGDFIAGARLDNLLSCYAGLQALIKAPGEETCLLICTDHEEVGSSSACGADGPMLEHTLRRLLPEGDEYVRTLQGSLLVSADNAHGVHPNYPDKHDANHGPKLNAGPGDQGQQQPALCYQQRERRFSSATCAWPRKCRCRVSWCAATWPAARPSARSPPATLGVRTVDIGVADLRHALDSRTGRQPRPGPSGESPGGPSTPPGTCRKCAWCAWSWRWRSAAG